MGFRSDSRQKKNTDKVYKYRNYYCYFCKTSRTPNNVKERKIIEFIKPKLERFKIKNGVNEERMIHPENSREDLLKEIDLLNSNLQIIYENYKKHILSKERYLQEKALIQNKKEQQENKLEEVKSDKSYSHKEFNANSLDEDSLLKAYVDSCIDRIIVSRSGKIEIIEK